MVQCCHISKLRDCSFKILHRILATPNLISYVRKNNTLRQCQWYDAIANIDHILLYCLATIAIHDELTIKLGDLEMKEWILSCQDQDVCDVVTVVNFAIYKAHLLSTSGYTGLLNDIVVQSLQCFAPVVRAIRTFDLI